MKRLNMRKSAKDPFGVNIVYRGLKERGNASGASEFLAWCRGSVLWHQYPHDTLPEKQDMVTKSYQNLSISYTFLLTQILVSSIPFWLLNVLPMLK